MMAWNTRMGIDGVWSGDSGCHSGQDDNVDGVWMLCRRLAPNQKSCQTTAPDDIRSLLSAAVQSVAGKQTISLGCPKYKPGQ